MQDSHSLEITKTKENRCLKGQLGLQKTYSFCLINNNNNNNNVFIIQIKYIYLYLQMNVIKSESN